MFLKIMLAHKERRKLKFFRLFEELPNGEYTVKKISELLSYSYTSTQKILNEMEAEFQDFFQEDFSLITELGTVQLVPTRLNYDTYYNYLIHRSIPYRAIICSLTEPDKDLLAFCKENFLSRASAMRQLQALADYVQEFDLLFNRSQLTFKGDERLIRITLFNFIWAASRGTEKSLNVLAKQPIDEALLFLQHEIPLLQDYVGRREIHLFAEIMYQRIRQGYYVVDDTRYEEAKFSENQRVKTTLVEHLAIPAEHLDAEFHFIQFMMFYAPTFQFAEDVRIAQMPSFSGHGQVLMPLLYKLDDYWAAEILPGDSSFPDNKVVHGNLFNVLFCYYIFPKRIPTLFLLMSYFRRKQTTCYKYLKEKYSVFLKKMSRRKDLQWLSTCYEDLADLFAWLTLDIFEEHQFREKLQVALVMESNYLFSQEIKGFLKDLSFIELIPFSPEHLPKTDFLITSSAMLIPEENHLPYVVFNFFDGETNYEKLYANLKRNYRKKCYAHMARSTDESQTS